MVSQAKTEQMVKMVKMVTQEKEVNYFNYLIIQVEFKKNKNLKEKTVCQVKKEDQELMEDQDHKVNSILLI